MANEMDVFLIDGKEYLSLLGDSRMLQALHAAGVGNWEGYEGALEIYEAREDE